MAIGKDLPLSEYVLHESPMKKKKLIKNKLGALKSKRTMT
jgi:hypothetical protein